MEKAEVVLYLIDGIRRIETGIIYSGFYSSVYKHRFLYQYEMEHFKKKFKLLILPNLIYSIGFLIIYTFLHWLLILKTELISAEEMAVDFWIPISLTGFFLFVYIYPKVKLLELKGWRDNKPFLYLFLSFCTVLIPVVIAQDYIRVSTGKLTKLQSISEIDRREKSKYYSLQSYHVEKTIIGIQTRSEAGGKYGQDLNLSSYFVCPIMESLKDTTHPYFNTWIGIHYSKTISNRNIDRSDQDRKIEEFNEESLSNFEGYDFSKFTYLDRLGNNSHHKILDEAVRLTKRSDSSRPIIILEPVNEPFEARVGNRIAWILGILIGGNTLWFICILNTSFATPVLRKKKRKSVHDLKEQLEFFIPKEGFFITPLILDLNVFIFLIMIFSGVDITSPDGSDLLNWGANYRPYVFDGQWWRLLTNCFLHNGVFHLMSNLLGLVLAGLLLEPVLGRIKYTIVYLITGILASIASIWYQSAVSVGASGAIFGLFGAFLPLLITNVFSEGIKSTFLISILIFIGYNLIMGLAGPTDNAAHLGGLLSGIIVGFVLLPTLKQQVEAPTD